MYIYKKSYSEGVYYKEYYDALRLVGQFPYLEL